VAKSETNVTRIKATDSKPATKAVGAKKVTKKMPKREPENRFLKGLYAFGGYFKGAWFELRQVRWPTRRATWGLTLAVILFSAFFVVLILLLDALFKYLFEIIIT
jgi:preprotein translocase SecE subunit